LSKRSNKYLIKNLPRAVELHKIVLTSSSHNRTSQAPLNHWNKKHSVENNYGIVRAKPSKIKLHSTHLNQYNTKRKKIGKNIGLSLQLAETEKKKEIHHRNGDTQPSTRKDWKMKEMQTHGHRPTVSRSHILTVARYRLLYRCWVQRFSRSHNFESFHALLNRSIEARTTLKSF